MTVKNLTTAFLTLAVLAFVVSSALAVVTIDTVFVGNPGNVGELSGQSIPGGRGPDRICGAVAYTYKMGKYEITNAQYCEFLNQKLPTISDPEMSGVLDHDTYGLYNSHMTSWAQGGIVYYQYGPAYGKFSVKSGYANRPVNYVSWYDCIRYVNWLQNGQGSGSTESGTYQIDGGGKNSGTVHIPTAAERGSWTWANPRWVLPSEDEWYKAAYHKNDGKTGNYWKYPTSTNEVPYSDDPTSLNYPANSANCRNDDGISGNGINDGLAVAPPYLTNVGDYAQSLSPYGTLDQGGNVWEWNETEVRADISSRGARGSSWYDNSDCLLSSGRSDASPSYEGWDLGFRVASVPEPNTIMLLITAAFSLFIWWPRQHGK